MDDAQRNENQHREDQPEPEPEQQRLPLGHSLSYGAGTFVAAGMVDLLAHLGPTGLVVGGIVAWVASQHGPELIEQVREAFPPSPAAPLATKQAEKTHEPQQHGNGGVKRSVLDRALGRFPVQEDMPGEDAETIIVAEPETAGEPLRRARRSGRAGD